MDNYCDEILKVLIYYELFQYPLTKVEIFERSKLTFDEVEQGVNQLLVEKRIFLIEGFYSLENNRSIAQTRIARNQLAQKYLPKARLISKIVSHFPFIRGIFLSGSISKNCMDKDSDIDFFIVTAPNRLWIARLVCVLFKKIFLLNSPKYFCFNYLIDSQHLHFEDRSLFIATEIASLIPVYGNELYAKIHDENRWIRGYFPNLRLRETPELAQKPPRLQRFLETLLDNRVGDWLDDWLLAKTLKINEKRHETKLFANPKFYLNFQKHVAKSHTTDNYPKIVKFYQEKTQAYIQGV